jgi:predicted RNA-binding protein with PUA-like domain
MTYFLAKTEPSTYSIDDLQKDQITTWDGVTNPLALKYIKSMLPKDMVLIYHSGKDAHIAGLAEVVGNPKIDPKNPKSFVVDLQFVRKFETIVTLRDIKESHIFDDSKLVRQGRLSTMEVSKEMITWLKSKGLQI